MTLTLSPYGKKEIGRRIVLGQTTLTKGNHNISLDKLINEDQEALGLLRGQNGTSCIWTVEKTEKKPTKSEAKKED